MAGRLPATHRADGRSAGDSHAGGASTRCDRRRLRAIASGHRNEPRHRIGETKTRRTRVCHAAGNVRCDGKDQERADVRFDDDAANIYPRTIRDYARADGANERDRVAARLPESAERTAIGSCLGDAEFDDVTGRTRRTRRSTACGGIADFAARFVSNGRRTPCRGRGVIVVASLPRWHRPHGRIGSCDLVARRDCEGDEQPARHVHSEPGVSCRGENERSCRLLANAAESRSDERRIPDRRDGSVDRRQAVRCGEGVRRTAARTRAERWSHYYGGRQLLLQGGTVRTRHRDDRKRLQGDRPKR